MAMDNRPDEEPGDAGARPLQPTSPEPMPDVCPSCGQRRDTIGMLRHGPDCTVFARSE